MGSLVVGRKTKNGIMAENRQKAESLEYQSKHCCHRVVVIVDGSDQCLMLVLQFYYTVRELFHTRIVAITIIFDFISSPIVESEIRWLWGWYVCL